MTAARAVWLGVVIGAIVDLLALGLSVFAAAAGHGSYLPALVLFPFPMLTTLPTGFISAVSLAVALLQFPAYGAVIAGAASRGRAAIGVAVLHAAAVAAALRFLKDGRFLL